jgi:hypothetical protein
MAAFLVKIGKSQWYADSDENGERRDGEITESPIVSDPVMVKLRCVRISQNA